jgi:hypothetical protein
MRPVIKNIAEKARVILRLEQNSDAAIGLFIYTSALVGRFQATRYWEFY